MRGFLLSVCLAAVSGQWQLHLIDQTEYPLAKCLDGSAPGFYFSPGSNNVFVVHTQGGGWCVSDADCASRAKSALGSSSGWASHGCDAGTQSTAPVCYADGGANGMLSNNSAANPPLWNANHVFINYCDGMSYASARTNPVQVGDQQIWYRGRYNLDAIYSELFKLGLASAESLIVSGCSAGGLAVYLHLDYLAAKVHSVNPATRVVGAPGAGFFLGEQPPFSGNGYLEQYKWVFNASNASSAIDGFSGTNDACLAAHAVTNDTWRCYIAPDVLPFIATPLFVSNSLSDAWQAGAIMGIGCSPTKAGACSPEQMGYLWNFRQDMLDLLEPVLAPGSPHGAFAQGCFVHVVEDTGGWTSVRVQNQTQAETFAAWFSGAPGKTAVVDTFPPWSNPTC